MHTISWRLLKMTPRKRRRYRTQPLDTEALELLRERISELGYYTYPITRPFSNFKRDFIAIENKIKPHPYGIKVFTVGLKRRGGIVIRPYWRMELYRRVEKELTTILIRHPHLAGTWEWGPSHDKHEGPQEWPESFGWLRLIGVPYRMKVLRLLQLEYPKISQVYD